ncbi:IS66 family insertion sequence element accessory protein TnpB [Vibrio sp. RW]|jgi:transposase|uniref:IS66 family insertion sequence element accessory protein TnpB n=1 Tax=Vibrio sp. RW TaxID=2998833 RepID=UPI0022CDB035|nr:IS66 family insertion sequence element accessory protein TnpB [Vibrio sp. RW]MDA0146413.1 IS66 family insertion sequence element accessory protein TnpB [Vibrio sp. RW]
MIHLTAQTQILLAIKPADFRCGIDGFVALCRHQLKQEPRSGTLFVFTNRRRTMLRALCYDGSGYWLMSKRLTKGRFQDWPRKSQETITPLVARQLKALLAGLPGWQRV